MTPKFYLFHLLLRYKIVILVVAVIFILFTSQANLHLYNFDHHYYEHEPIDVVYTWVNGSDPKFISDLKYILKTNTNETPADSSPQRFDDKYELKFSLRSIEKYAPWVRHVYIVTNGQVPYWLNMDYEKVTVISHKDIFTDSDDLPTFSSPAIESHLHRIPGLSKRFIYFNDDIFLGASVYLEDFYSKNRGHLIYLTWQVPPCANDCPWMYVNDGQCDIQCYNPACQMDGSDCDNELKDRDGNILKQTDTLDPPDYQHEDEVNHTKDSSQIPKPTKLSEFLRKGHNSSNIIKAIQNHNTKIMNDNKKRRKKLKYRRGTFSERVKRTPKPRTDAFGESLQHTNRLLNGRYGFKTRYVAAHAPILIDRDIMDRMQMIFHTEFYITSKNKIRSVNDMQYALGYYYFLMQEQRKINVGMIFDDFDTDMSGTWSDREIRTVLTKLYELPLSYAVVDHFESMLTECSSFLHLPEVTTPEFERYIDSKLPTISRAMVTNCVTLANILLASFGHKHLYDYEIITNAHSKDVTFKMLTSNISDVVGHLDEIRRKTTKFVCLNDNLESGKDEDNDLVKSVLYDFYLSLFPTPSQFELPPEFRNRFLNLDELTVWKNFHTRLKLLLIVTFLIILYICTFHFTSRNKKCCVLNK